MGKDMLMRREDGGQTMSRTDTTPSVCYVGSGSLGWTTHLLLTRVSGLGQSALGEGATTQLPSTLWF